MVFFLFVYTFNWFIFCLSITVTVILIYGQQEFALSNSICYQNPNQKVGLLPHRRAVFFKGELDFIRSYYHDEFKQGLNKSSFLIV